MSEIERCLRRAMTLDDSLPLRYRRRLLRRRAIQKRSLNSKSVLNPRQTPAIHSLLTS
ncbi:hypothetical protein [uncultured Nostoc sp.]|uniref:hypothetical protein n=1 Tax=uncultured Nostoc sp. TaxID=340711 RepID=UPI0035C9A7E2